MEQSPTSSLSDYAHRCNHWINQWADDPAFTDFAHRLQRYLYDMRPGAQVSTTPADPARQPWAVAVMADHLFTADNSLHWEFSDDLSTFRRLRGHT